jgi:hypothetical protein
MSGRSRAGRERQARLKPQFAHLYDDILAGEWMPAWLLAEKLFARAEQEGGFRVEEAHFEFRGGIGRPPELTELRTRATDPRPPR